ncbi:MAG: hydrogenase [Pseudomonadales bacterium]|nr:hydrogenase [Pseudomonadales bacterium]
MTTDFGRWTQRLGILLFLLGLISGLLVPAMANPRMGLTSHLEGVMNGTFLVVLGLLWTQLTLGRVAQQILFGVTMYGSYANWLATTLAGWWGAGAGLMPIAGGEHVGSAVQEGLIAFALISLSVAMVVACVMILFGLRGPGPAN